MERSFKIPAIQLSWLKSSKETDVTHLSVENDIHEISRRQLFIKGGIIIGSGAIVGFAAGAGGVIRKVNQLFNNDENISSKASATANKPPTTAQRSAENDPLTAIAEANYNKTLDWFRYKNDQYFDAIAQDLKLPGENSLVIWTESTEGTKFAYVAGDTGGGKLKIHLYVNGFARDQFDDRSIIKAAQDIHTAYYELKLANTSGSLRYQRDADFREKIHLQAQQMTQILFFPYR